MSFDPSDEVASDFLDALMSLNMNNRYEISNLTVIAKENTESAFAISEALKNHIKQTSPQKKLPAFYVLDSIVKNVGTPYTLFFGRQLYQTFMEAYALMDTNTRKKMDEMLKTWKEAVPGSMDPRPVFPPDITRPIENALIKARTSALEAHQQYQRSQPQMGRGRPMVSPSPYRDTSTPPGVVRQPMNAPPGYASNYAPPQYPPPQAYVPPQPYPNPQQYSTPQQYSAPQPYPNSQPYPNAQPYPNQMNGQQQQQQPYVLPQRPPSQQQYSQPPQGVMPWQQPPQQGYHAHESSVDALNNDIANLITSSKIDFAQNPGDVSIQTRLKALLDLQSILSSERLPPNEIALIKDQVSQLSKDARQPPRIQTPPVHVAPPAPVFAAPPPPQQPSLNSILGPGALAALLARQSATPQPAVDPPIRSPPRQIPVTSSSTPAPDPMALLASLRAAGILGGSKPAAPLPFMNTPPTSRTPLAEIPNDVELKTQSLKMPRPHLISSLYEKLGTPCNQCGRRFKTDEEGKKKKIAHLDWHFKANHKMAETEDRGQHRTWYLDETDWINSREIIDEQTEDNADNTSGARSSAPAKPKVQYIEAPEPSANNICPICQDPHQVSYIDDLWVWLNAMKVGDRYYHIDCYNEAHKNGGSAQAMRGTPEPVLGKRKAEDEHSALRPKIKSEPDY